MNTLKRIPLLSTIIAFILVLSGCSGSKKDDFHLIKVGVSSGPEYALAEAAKKVAKEKYALEVEIIPFNDYVVPNEALNQGDIDVNAFQHLPYLEEQSKQRGYTLAVVGKTFLYPIAGYSKKIKKLNELKSGSTIAIPNDPTNGGRSLLLLQKNGLITLKENTGLLPKVTDITANPKNLKIVELEAPQLPRVLDDQEVTIAIINNTFSAQAGLVPSRDALFVEDKDSPYVNLIVSRETNKTQKKVEQFVKAYQSAEVEKAAEEQFKGGAVKGW
ncbi:methionine ABC transporter substrate-binding lipoprotein MetQ [Flavobacterium sp. DG1-102-2]|uniref:methionine ABC transporter substrate-binding lipoprotein MetQ n=1 Tax=Flavobacterium sp. DG1-102-2 TaxID=3081663 RepID=UPI00294A0F52|nr:methionine ABC transporter substrate-binding lipoprotein MetQ [Flavobacterium sp. DG1-102-2]MDV6169790.1 methionine ABC transporter substrate-binding lipoprotein MetQ [Flavobacterium sp. DG1-102-2]